MLTIEVRDKLRLRRVLLILAGVIILACLVTGGSRLYDIFVIRYQPDRLLTMRQLDAVKPSQEVMILVEVSSADTTSLRGFLLDRAPDSSYQRTTRPIAAYVSLDSVDVLGTLQYRPGDIVQLQGTLDTLTPSITIRVWHHLSVTDQVTIR